MDNSSDSFGLVADWVAVTRRWRSNSPATRGRGCDFGHQPRDWASSCIKSERDPCYLWLLTTDNTEIIQKDHC